MSPVDLLTLAVLAAVGFRLAEAARASIARRDHVLALWGALRPRHVAAAVPVLAGVILVAAALLQVPGLDWGWWTAIGGDGNPVLAESESTDRLGISAALTVLFLGFLVVALPLLVEGEERWFRLGAERRSTVANLRRSVSFGLVHALVGIPVAAALALSVGGAYLTAVYLRAWRAGRDREAALEAATLAHLGYDCFVLALVVPLLLAGV